LVLRPASSITAFQHHVTRSLRWFNVSSPGSSPCWLDHCVSTTCDLITAVDPVDHCNGSTLVLLVLRPTGLITAFQHHVIRSLRRFHVESRGSSPCWLDHCVSTPCDSNTAAVPRWFSWFFALLARSLRFNTCDSITAAVPRQITCVYSFVGSVLFGSSSLYLSRRPTVQCSYSVLFGSSPCWLVHCVSTPYDSITAAVPRWFSWFFALLARSLRFNTMWLDHCGGSTLDLPVLRPAGSIIAFQHHVTRSLRRFHVGSPGSLP
jgi:hypothetical protein